MSLTQDEILRLKQLSDSVIHPPPPPFLDKHQTAKLLHISVRVLMEKYKEWGLAYVPLTGKTILFSYQSILDYLSANLVNSKTKPYEASCRITSSTVSVDHR